MLLIANPHMLKVKKKAINVNNSQIVIYPYDIGETFSDFRSK
jgi:hypothetical protein